MAKFEMEGIDDIEKQLYEMAGNSEELAEEMIDAATPIMEEEFKKAIHSVANRGYATGELERAVKATKAKTNQYGSFAVISVAGTDKRGTTNAEKLAYLHYGTSRQEATGVVTKVVNAAEEKCIAKMQEVFNKRIKKNDN